MSFRDIYPKDLYNYIAKEDIELEITASPIDYKKSYYNFGNFRAVFDDNKLNTLYYKSQNVTDYFKGDIDALGRVLNRKKVKQGLKK